MISFLNGFILPALFAATIPIILHFLSKKKAKKLPFSSLKFLKVIENQRIRRVKLFQVLLIIARTLFIIFLVLAFSRPTVSTYSGGTSNAQTTAVILLDDSYSMQSFAYSKTYFELAKEKIFNLLNSFSADDHVFLCYNKNEEVVVINKENAQQILARLVAGNEKFSLNKSFLVADSVFRKNLNLNNELYIISDFKISPVINDSDFFTGINNFRAYKINIAEDIPFKNVSIDTIIIENQFFELNKPFTILVRLTNHEQEKAETNLNLFNGDERVAMEYTSLESLESKTFTVQYIPKTEGIHFLKLQLEEDDLSFDNNWFFSFYMREEISALFISDNTTAAMQAALKILTENTIFNIKQMSFSEWQGTNLFRYDLVVMNDFKEMSSNALIKLKDYVQLEDHSIVVIPGFSASLDKYNAFFSSIMDRPLFALLKDSKNQGYFSLENQKTANAIFSSLFRDKQSSFTTPKIFRYYKQTGDSQGLIHLSNGDPFITKTNPFVVFSSSFNSDWTDIEINGIFLPLLYRTFYLASQTKNPVSEMHETGDYISFRVQGATIDKDYFIQIPAGNKFSVIPTPTNNNLVFEGGIANDRGFYLLLNENIPIATLAINHSSKELSKPFVDDADIGFKISNLNSQDFLEQIQSARLGFELWIISIVLAFIMLIAEMGLIKIIEGTPFLKKYDRN